MEGFTAVLCGVVVVLVLLWLILRYWLSGDPCDCCRDMHGKCALITGATSGMGTYIARRLAQAGADIVLLVRRKDAGEALVDELYAKYPECGNVRVVCADLLDLESVCSAIPEIKRALAELAKLHKDGDVAEDGKEPPLHVLVNNAGVLFAPMKETVQGLEPHFGVNYVASFVLTRSLLPCLRAAGRDARVISMSSITYKLAQSALDGISEDLFTYNRVAELGNKAPSAMVRYAHSKYAILLFMLALNRKEGEAGSCVRAFAVDPGVALTSITRSLPAIINKLWLLLFAIISSSSSSSLCHDRVVLFFGSLFFVIFNCLFVCVCV